MKPMALEIHEIWEMVKNILDILDKIYHAVINEEEKTDG
jgi:hypothetical protein